MKREGYDLNPNKCKSCDENLSWEKRRNKYCNHSCSAKSNNQGVRRHGEAPNNCVVCGNITKGKMYSCCSSICANINKQSKYIRRWKRGAEDGVKGKCGLSNYIRNYLFEKNGNRCQKCSWGEINGNTGKMPLSVHHIDGKWMNNREDNLELLCPNCHSLTDTYGYQNRGNGRNNRKFTGGIS